MNSDSITKKTVLRAPLDRVWRAISDAEQFGQWFGARFEGPFVPGKALDGVLTPTSVDEGVAALQRPHEGKALRIWVVEVVPQSRLSFEWHPAAADPLQEDAAQARTLVSFDLKAMEGGTELVVTETGFDRLPPARATFARTSNEGGWEHQLRLVAKYVRLEAAP